MKLIDLNQFLDKADKRKIDQFNARMTLSKPSVEIGTGDLALIKIEDDKWDFASLEFELKGQENAVKPTGAHIHGLGTKPKYRNQGWATMLMKVITRYFDFLGVHSSLVAQPDNNPKQGALKMNQLVAFYKKFGYIVIEELSTPTEIFMIRDAAVTAHATKKAISSTKDIIIDIPLNDLLPGEGGYYNMLKDLKEGTVKPQWKGMVEAMMKGEVLPDIMVRRHGNKYVVINGNHRLAVAKWLKKPSMRAWIVDDPNPGMIDLYKTSKSNRRIVTQYNKTKKTNKAMYPVQSRVPEIESLIRGNKPLLAAYNDHVKACEERGIGFFENRTIATNKIKKLSTYDREPIERALWGAAVADFDKGEIIAYHVADNPDKAMKTLTEKRSFVKQSGDWEDLGRGFYASGNPWFWKGRSTKRYDVLKKMTLKQREEVRAYITKERIKGRPGYLTENERETVKRDLDDFVETGQPGYLSYSLNQPVNVDLDEMLKVLGISPYDPYVVVLRLKGRFFDIYSTSDFLNELAYLWVEKHYPGRAHGKSDFHYLMKDFQFDGMFQRGYFLNPQIVIWSWKAVVGYDLVKLSSLKS